MTNDEFVTVGFDPGGDKAFGWAVVKWKNGETSIPEGGRGIENSAEDALEKAGKIVGLKCPTAVGIDAPLFWTLNPHERRADRLVREEIKVGRDKRSVLNINSLRGACLAQGLVLVQLIRDHSWKQTEITETHPVAMWKCLGMGRNNPHLKGLLNDADFVRMAKRFEKLQKGASRSKSTRDHEIDAVLSAYAAKKGLEGEWPDLMRKADRDSPGCISLGRLMITLTSFITGSRRRSPSDKLKALNAT